MLASDFENQETPELPSQDGLEQAFLGLLKLAQDQFNAGQYAYAIDYLKPILQANPRQPDSNHLLVKVLMALRDYETALPYIEICLQMSPENVLYWDTYVELLHFFGDAEVLSQALALKAEILQQNVTTVPSEPSDSGNAVYLPDLSAELELLMKTKNTSKKHSKKVEDAAFCQLLALCEAKKYQELERYSKHLITENICAGFAWRFLGVMFLELKQLAQAKQVMAESIRLLPNDATSHFNYALACAELNELDTAECFYRKAIQLDRNFTAAYNNLGNLLKSSKKFDEAESILRKLVKLDPNSPIPRFNLVSVLVQKDAMSVALDEAIMAEKLFPHSADIRNALGSIYFLLERHEEAIPHLLKAIEFDPNYADAYNNLGSVYFDQKHFGQARPLFLKALEINPDSGGAMRCLGQISLNVENNHIESIRWTRLALAQNPKDSAAHASLLFMLSEYGVLTPEELFLEHRRFGEMHEPKLLRLPSSFSNTRIKDRPLTIGFFSGDLRHHAVTSFLAPIFHHLKDNKGLRLIAYYTHNEEDDVSQKLKTYFDAWRHVKTMDNGMLSRLVQSDEVDILFDLSGHTSDNRLTLFANRVAPIQVSWIGYPGTTGLSNMDYFISERFLTPIAEQSQYFTEKICNLPSSAPFEPYEDAPPIADLPMLKNGYVTFGSFNRITKITSNTIVLWARLLNQIKDSKLFLGGMPPTMSNYESFVEEFAAAGVGCDRLEFFGRGRMDIYLQQYRHIDLCLDAFPYNGATTTLHGLWMGVPTLSIKGNQLVSRNGYAMMGQVGLDFMVAEDEAGFIQNAIYWANHPSELAEIRRNLRDRCLASPKFHPGLIAQYLNQAIRQMWHRWCDELPPAAFEIEEKS